MACDDFLCLDIHAEEFAHALGYITVGCSVETVAAHMILLVQLVWHSIEVCVVGHGAVESIVEDCNLWHIRHQGVNGTYATQVSGIVNRCKVAQALDTILNLLSYEAALLKEVTTLHYTMSYSINLIKALQCTELRVEQALEHEVHAFLMVGHVVHDDFLLSTWKSNLNESLIKSYTFNTTLCEHGLIVHVVKFVLN